MIQPRAPSFGARLCHALVYTHLIGERSQRRLKSNLEHYQQHPLSLRLFPIEAAAKKAVP